MKGRGWQGLFPFPGIPPLPNTSLAWVWTIDPKINLGGERESRTQSQRRPKDLRLRRCLATKGCAGQQGLYSAGVRPVTGVPRASLPSSLQELGKPSPGGVGHGAPQPRPLGSARPCGPQRQSGAALLLLKTCRWVGAPGLPVSPLHAQEGAFKGRPPAHKLELCSRAGLCLVWR